MTYYLGVDGGTTRTKAVVGDDVGHIVGSGEGGASNYQVVGLEAAMSGITNAVQTALMAADLSLSQIERGVFGLSGMDLPMHREALDAALTTTFPGLIFDLVNDTWIMLRAGSNKGWGIALVCGGGANACACSRDGAPRLVRHDGGATKPVQPGSSVVSTLETTYTPPKLSATRRSHQVLRRPQGQISMDSLSDLFIVQIAKRFLIHYTNLHISSFQSQRLFPKAVYTA